MEPLPRSALYGQVRVGRVSAVGKSRHTVEVKFEEVDGFISWDLHVLSRNPGDYALPAVDTPVLCLLLDGRLGVGFVLGCFYTEEDEPPLSDEGQRSIAGDDIRLGDPEASDKVALSSLVKSNFDTLFDILDDVFGASSASIPDAPSGVNGVYTAVKAAIAAKQLAGDWPLADVAAEKVKAK